jgi:hypothetical protein
MIRRSQFELVSCPSDVAMPIRRQGLASVISHLEAVMFIVSPLCSIRNSLAYASRAVLCLWKIFNTPTYTTTQVTKHTDTLVTFRYTTEKYTHHPFPAVVADHRSAPPPLWSHNTHTHTKIPTNLPQCLSPLKPSDLIAPAAFLGYETFTSHTSVPLASLR